MSTQATLSAIPAISLVPPTGRAASTAEALGQILAGQPFRDGLRPAVAPMPRPASVQEGIEWILRGLPR